MAKQTVKTRNPERRSGKAWGKSHVVKVKVLTSEQQERKAHKDAERERRRSVSHERGSNLTMPRFNWEWAAETWSGSGRVMQTRRFRTVEAVLAKERSGS